MSQWVQARMSIPRDPHETDSGESCECHHHFQCYLAGEFGGYTVTEGLGGWVHGGQYIREEVLVYDVAVCLGDQRALEELQALPSRIREQFHQEAAYVALTNLIGGNPCEDI